MERRSSSLKEWKDNEAIDPSVRQQDAPKNGHPYNCPMNAGGVCACEEDDNNNNFSRKNRNNLTNFDENRFSDRLDNLDQFSNTQKEYLGRNDYNSYSNEYSEAYPNDFSQNDNSLLDYESYQYDNTCNQNDDNNQYSHNSDKNDKNGAYEKYLNYKNHESSQYSNFLYQNDKSYQYDQPKNCHSDKHYQYHNPVSYQYDGHEDDLNLPQDLSKSSTKYKFYNNSSSKKSSKSSKGKKSTKKDEHYSSQENQDIYLPQEIDETYSHRSSPNDIYLSQKIEDDIYSPRPNANDIGSPQENDSYLPQKNDETDFPDRTKDFYRKVYAEPVEETPEEVCDDIQSESSQEKAQCCGECPDFMADNLDFPKLKVTAKILFGPAAAISDIKQRKTKKST